MTYQVNRKQFYKAIWKRWPEERSVSSIPMMARYIKDLDVGDFGLAAKVLRIFHTFRDISIDCTMWDAYQVYLKYWDKIDAYVLKRVKKRNGHFPTMGYTETISELIARGWVHINEAHRLDKHEVHLYCHIAPLVWPDSFEQHMEAIEVLGKVGIPGRTGTKLPKSK